MMSKLNLGKETEEQELELDMKFLAVEVYYFGRH